MNFNLDSLDDALPVEESPLQRAIRLDREWRESRKNVSAPVSKPVKSKGQVNHDRQVAAAKAVRDQKNQAKWQARQARRFAEIEL